MAKLPLTPDQEVQELDWEVYLRETAKQILAEQSPRRLLEVRGRLYELISHCIPPEVNNYSLFILHTTVQDIIIRAYFACGSPHWTFC